MSTEHPSGTRLRTPDIRALILTGMLGIAAALTVGTQLHHEHALHRQRSQIEALEHKQTIARARAVQARDETMQHALGITPDRVSGDETRISDLMSTAFTWDSGSVYDTARTSLERRYGLRATSQFMAQAMPLMPHRIDPGGRSYDYIDAMGMSSRLGSDSIVPIGASATTYRYVARATIIVKETSAISGETSRDVLVYASIDGGGNVTALSAVPSGGLTRTSD